MGTYLHGPNYPNLCFLAYSIFQSGLTEVLITRPHKQEDVGEVNGSAGDFHKKSVEQGLDLKS